MVDRYRFPRCRYRFGNKRSNRSQKRFLAWGNRWHLIKRPIYFSYALQAATSWIKEKKLSELGKWLDLGDWIVQQPYVANQSEGQSDESALNPDWDSARRAVVDLVEACLTKEVGVPIEWQTRLFGLINAAAIGADRYLDEDKPIVKPRDYLTDAINTTRGRALQNLISYGFWIRRNRDSQTDVSELFEVLEKRFNGQPALTNPEYALLGTEFNRLFILAKHRRGNTLLRCFRSKGQRFGALALLITLIGTALSNRSSTCCVRTSSSRSKAYLYGPNKRNVAAIQLLTSASIYSRITFGLMMCSRVTQAYLSGSIRTLPRNNGRRSLIMLGAHSRVVRPISKPT